MAENNYQRVQRALEKQRAESRAKALDRASAASLPSTILSVADVAATVAELMADQRREILEHTRRMVVLLEAKSSTASIEAKLSGLHRRLFVLESELRTMKGKPR